MRRNNTKLKITITNLYNDGMLKFDFMEDDRYIDILDLLDGNFNVINEIDQYHSYSFQSNHSNENRQIIISNRNNKEIIEESNKQKSNN